MCVYMCVCVSVCVWEREREAPVCRGQKRQAHQASFLWFRFTCNIPDSRLDLPESVHLPLTPHSSRLCWLLCFWKEEPWRSWASSLHSGCTVACILPLLLQLGEERSTKIDPMPSCTGPPRDTLHLEQCFSSFNVHPRQWGSCENANSGSVGLGWAWGPAFIPGFQAMLMLLVHRPHFNSEGWRNFTSNLSRFVFLFYFILFF